MMMLTEAEQQIRIDLDQFKLHLKIEHKIQLSLHFDTPSRKFYLSVIAFVLNEIANNQGIKSIPLNKHPDVLALLNETVGGLAGSSQKRKLIPRIYKKWKSDLPDLENAPLFRVVGRKKEYGSGIDKAYVCSEDEKDSWANLFEYKGSGENVRLRVAIDAIGANTENCAITYKGQEGNKAWLQYITDLKKERESRNDVDTAAEKSAMAHSEKKGGKVPLRKQALATTIALILIAVGIMSLKLFPGRSESIEPASLHQMAYPLPEKPSIAVLAFRNLSGNPDDEYFSDGITEEIITALSLNHKLFVISSNSTFKYKGKPVTVQQVSEELGVRYVLQGSVTKVNDQVRITAQLVDAVKGHHLWAERYNRKLHDIFAIQDNITLRITGALDVALVDGAEGAIGMHYPKNLDTYLKILQANKHMALMTRNDNIRFRELALEAIELDPYYDVAWGHLGFSHLFEVYFGWSESPKASIEKAVEIAQKVDQLGGRIMKHSLWSFIYRVSGQPEKAIREIKESIALNPNHSGSCAFLGGIYVDIGRHKEAIVYFKKAMRLNPFYPSWYLSGLGLSYMGLAKYDEAIKVYESLLKRGDFGFIGPRVALIIANASIGNEKEAQVHAQELLKVDPTYNVEKYMTNIERKRSLNITQMNAAALEHQKMVLRKAGIPEFPPASDQKSDNREPALQSRSDLKKLYKAESLRKASIPKPPPTSNQDSMIDEGMRLSQSELVDLHKKEWSLELLCKTNCIQPIRGTIINYPNGKSKAHMFFGSNEVFHSGTYIIKDGHYCVTWVGADERCSKWYQTGENEYWITGNDDRGYRATIN